MSNATIKQVSMIAAGGIIGGWVLSQFVQLKSLFFDPVLTFLFDAIIVPRILLIVILVILLCIIGYLISYLNNGMSFRKFNEFQIGEIFYHWKYDENAQQISISHINAHCPVCHMELATNSNGQYRCSNSNGQCLRNKENYKFGRPLEEDIVKRQIIIEVIKRYPKIKDRLM
jgi:hypothetical protein